MQFELSRLGLGVFLSLKEERKAALFSFLESVSYWEECELLYFLHIAIIFPINKQ